jgi:hypothetical protein
MEEKHLTVSIANRASVTDQGDHPMANSDVTTNTEDARGA